MPLPVRTDTMLGWAFLTGAINEIKPDASLFTRMLFPQERTVPTESIELSYLDGDRNLAPFVELNAEAISVPGRAVRFANVMAPNIRIKRPMDAYTSLIRRQPGSSVFVTSNDITGAYRQAIADDTQILSSLITNRIEEMCCKMAATAVYTYTVAEQGNFRIAFPRAANLAKTLSGTALWGSSFSDSGVGSVFTEGSASDPLRDLDTGKFMLGKYSFSPTIAFFGRRAAVAFRHHSKTKDAISNQRNMVVGNTDFTTQFNDDGALRMGNFAGMECWEYSRTYLDDAGTEKFFLDADTILMVSPAAQRDNILYFGAIPDHDAFDDGLYQTRIFSKSWKQPDPSTRTQLAHSRPLPCLRRVNTVYALTSTAV